MLVWDVSQNVDWFKAGAGIVPCITPSGIDFVTNRQSVLTGSELLILQGIPSDKLILGKETQKDLQDLAGNAMTSTVIGASIIAALISSSKAFRLSRLPRPEQRSTPILDSCQLNLALPKSMQARTLSSPSATDFDVASFISDARIASKLCSCETSLKSQWNIQICEQCGHTACSTHAGVPKHQYKSFVTHVERHHTPESFQRVWRPRLPPRLQFKEFPDIEEIVKTLSAGLGTRDVYQLFTSLLRQIDITSIYFHLSNFERLDNRWKVSYNSPEADLELTVSDTIKWLLYLRTPKSEPGNSPLRNILSLPLARGFAHTSLLNLTWEVHIPLDQSDTISVTASNESTSSWRSRLGLLDYKNEKTPLQLSISNNSGQFKELTGTYSRLDNCGTSNNTLYKCVRANKHLIYLFLDPDPTGSHEKDSFVFSEEHRRLPYGTSRETLGYLEESFRPSDLNGNKKFRAMLPGYWVPKKIHLEVAVPPMSTLTPSNEELSQISSSNCQEAVGILSVKIPQYLDVIDLSQYSWVLEQAKLHPSFPQWHRFRSECASKNCRCSPSLPPIHWHVNERGEIIAQEDRKAAAIFERSTKTQPPIVEIRASTSSKYTCVNIGINVASLAQKAAKKLRQKVNCSWRLITNHVNIPIDDLPNFTVGGNETDLPFDGKLRLKHTLSKKQSQCLTWMKSQEKGQRFIITEVEESIHPGLGWRVEAKVDGAVTIHGGVLADLPSFGKTVSIITLINSEFEHSKPRALLKCNRKLAGSTSFIDVAATLVICPPHITKQWKTELECSLGKALYD